MTVIDDAALKQIFLDAHTFNGWIDRPVDDAVVHQLYDVLKLGPTSANTTPARFLFVKSKEAKELLKPALAPMNVDKTMSAPLVAVIAYDTQFHEKMGTLFPARPEFQKMFAAMQDPAKSTFLLQNASLQSAYLIIAARALGLDCGPMGGFDKDKVDAAFFKDTSWKSVLVVNLGYGDPATAFPRNPRLSFDEACKVV